MHDACVSCFDARASLGVVTSSQVIGTVLKAQAQTTLLNAVVSRTCLGKVELAVIEKREEW